MTVVQILQDNDSPVRMCAAGSRLTQASCFDKSFGISLPVYHLDGYPPRCIRFVSSWPSVVCLFYKRGLWRSTARRHEGSWQWLGVDVKDVRLQGLAR